MCCERLRSGFNLPSQLNYVCFFFFQLQSIISFAVKPNFCTYDLLALLKVSQLSSKTFVLYVLGKNHQAIQRREEEGSFWVNYFQSIQRESFFAIVRHLSVKFMCDINQPTKLEQGSYYHQPDFSLLSSFSLEIHSDA